MLYIYIVGGEAWNRATSQNLSGHGCLPIESWQSENFAEVQLATLGRANGAARDKTRQDPQLSKRLLLIFFALDRQETGHFTNHIDQLSISRNNNFSVIH